jgi:hypothetical protein
MHLPDLFDRLMQRAFLEEFELELLEEFELELLDEFELELLEEFELELLDEFELELPAETGGASAPPAARTPMAVMPAARCFHDLVLLGVFDASISFSLPSETGTVPVVPGGHEVAMKPT